MKNLKNYICAALVLLLLSPVLNAGDFDSSSPLPVMTAAILETKTAGKAYGDYLSLRKRETELFAELTSPAFEQQPHDKRELRRAECLTSLGNIARDEYTQLKTYQVHLSNAIAAYGKVGPGQITSVQSRLEAMRAAMAADIERQAAAAGALADTAKFGGLTPKQTKQFRAIITQLKRKQAMEEYLSASGGKLADVGLGLEGVISYLEEIRDGIDISLFEAESNIAYNTAAKAYYFVKELGRQICGDQPCGPDMFGRGQDHSRLIGGLPTGQTDTAKDEETTEELIEKYRTR